jgi:hypothetical protein
MFVPSLVFHPLRFYLSPPARLRSIFEYRKSYYLFSASCIRVPIRVQRNNPLPNIGATATECLSAFSPEAEAFLVFDFSRFLSSFSMQVYHIREICETFRKSVITMARVVKCTCCAYIGTSFRFRRSRRIATRRRVLTWFVAPLEWMSVSPIG